MSDHDPESSYSSTSRGRSSTEEDAALLSPRDEDSPFEIPALPEGIGLKPRLDSIFADVQANLPSVDFDDSDLSSDEDVTILSRSFHKPRNQRPKTQTFSTELWKSVLESDQETTSGSPSYQLVDPCSLSDRSTDGKDSRVSKSGLAEIEGKIDTSQVSRGQRLQQERNLTVEKSLLDSDDEDDETLEEIEEIIGFEKCLLDSSAVDPKIQGLLTNSLLNNNNHELPAEVHRALHDDKQKPKVIKRSPFEEDEIVVSLMPKEAPVLEMLSIDHIDLDLLLDAFPERQVRRQQPAGRQRHGNVQNNERGVAPGYGEGDARTNTDSNLLMDQLTQLCIKQSGGTVSPDELKPKTKEKQGRPHKLQDKDVKIAWEDETMKNLNKYLRYSQDDMTIDLSSLRDTPSPDGTEILNSLRKVEQQSSGRETVFLDLRKKEEQNVEQSVEVSDAVRRILQQHSPNKDSESSSDGESDDEDPRAAWHKQKRKTMQELAKSQEQKKGALVQDQGRPDKMGLAVTPHRVHDISAVEKKQHATEIRSQRSHSGVPPTPPQSPAESSTPTRSDSIAARDQEKLRQAKIIRILREEKEQERQGRLRLMKQLQAMRPQGSVTNKHPSARATPIVFDLEASYSSSPEILPSILSADLECALLTARLSKLGELLPHRSSGSRFLEGSNGISASYFALLSFLLSLVPDNFRFLVDETEQRKSEGKYLDDVPFRVVGMQQVCQEDDVVLHVAIVPKIADECSLQPPKGRRTQLRTELKGFSPFQQIVTRFLTISTLQTMCPWMDDLNLYTISSHGELIDIPQESRNESVLVDGTYIPPLPQITTKPLSTFLTLNQDLKVAERVFSIPVGFFWQTIETQESLCQYIAPSVGQDIVDIQNTMSLIYKQMYRNPHHMMSMFHRILQEGLDLSGFRLLYVDNTVLQNPSAIHNQTKLNTYESNIDPNESGIGPILAIALRGSQARTAWLDVVGPSDPILARKTDPKSLMALYGGSSRDELFIYCPRNPNRINYDLALWFGGRVPANGTIDIKAMEPVARTTLRESKKTDSPKSKKSRKGPKRDSSPETTQDEFTIQRMPVATLAASTHGDVFLTVSPVVPPLCLGIIISSCQRRGYQACGVKRMRLNSKRAAGLGLSGPQVRIFSPISCTTPTSPKNYEDTLRSQIESGLKTTTKSPMPSFVLMLRKENAMHHAPSLQEALMLDLSLHGLLSTIEENCDTQLRANLCFHMTSFSESLLATLGGDFSYVPQHETHYSSCVPSSFYSNPELEQIVVIAFSGSNALRRVGDSIGKLLGLVPLASLDQKLGGEDGLELLGLKFIPSLTMSQAKELTPFEVGDYNWHSSIQTLSSKPALICVMRGINAFEHTRDFAKTPPSPRRVGSRPPVDTLEILVSVSPEIAYRQSTIFFRDQELFADPSMRANLKYFPPLRSPSLEDLSTARFSWTEEPTLSPGSKKSRGKGSAKGSKGTLIVEESIFKTMLAGPRLLTTVLLIKPLALHKHLSKILKRVLHEDFTIVGLRLLMLTPNMAAHLVPSQDRSNRVLSSMHIEHLMSGPCLALCLQRENAVKKLLDLLGPPHPQEAKRKNQFYWRGLYGADPINNALHGSECYLGAVEEIKLLFTDGLCCLCTPDLSADCILAPGVDYMLGSDLAKQRRFTVRRMLDSSDSACSLLSSLSSSSSLDSFMSPRCSQGVTASSSELFLPSHSALCQTNCLLLAPPLQLIDVGGHRKSYVEVIDALLSSGFEMVGMRMVWLTREQAEEFSAMYHSSFPNLVKILCHGPCIVLAVQRDNAVSCLDSLLGSYLQKDSVINKYGDNIFRPKDSDESAKYLSFFFDEVMPHCQGQIRNIKE